MPPQDLQPKRTLRFVTAFALSSDLGLTHEAFFMDVAGSGIIRNVGWIARFFARRDRERIISELDYALEA